MLYKEMLTVRLATAQEFLEHHPTCHELVSVPYGFLVHGSDIHGLVECE